MHPRVLFRSVDKSFELSKKSTPALKDVSFSIAPGEFVSLVGPSGCGKSTILNAVAGLIAIDSGSVQFDGHEVQGPNTHVGYLTQDDALLPWRSVLTNVALPLEIKHVPKSERQDRAREMLDLVGLSDFAKHRPGQLSGGMRQRVSLARTLVYRPDTLLLDEPFGALDAQTRIVLQTTLLNVVAELGVTTLLVTHDLGEAASLSDRILVFSRRPAQVLQEVPMPASDDVDPRHRLQHRRDVPDRLWDLLKTQQNIGAPV